MATLTLFLTKLFHTFILSKATPWKKGNVSGVARNFQQGVGLVGAWLQISHPQEAIGDLGASLQPLEARESIGEAPSIGRFLAIIQEK